MPDPKIITGKDGRQYVDAPGMDPIPVEDLKGPTGESPSWLSRTGSFLKNASPEITAGLADVLAPSTFGLSMLAAPAVAGVTDAARQYGDTGHVDLGAAAFRGAENIIPGAMGRGLTKMLSMGAPAAMDVAGGMLKGGVKGGLWAAAKSAMGLGASDAAATATPIAASELSRMTLGDGTRVLSTKGLEQLTALEQKLALAGQNLDHPQFRALDDLIQHVREAIEPTKLSAADLLSKVGMKTSTVDAEAAAAKAAVKAAMAKKAGRTLNMGLRTGIGATQGAIATAEGM